MFETVTPTCYAACAAALMGGLLVEVAVFRAIHDDPPSTYKLFALRDRLIRLVIEGKVERYQPYFDALYRNLNILLKGCRQLSGPKGWQTAGEAGKRLARQRVVESELAEMPHGPPPEILEPVLAELREALEHLLKNHFGLRVLLNERRREIGRLQRKRARHFLEMMREGNCPA